MQIGMQQYADTGAVFGTQVATEELAKQATGSVVVTQGDTTVLVTAVISKEEKDYDFFPLTVDFIEKMYAVGRIPGGYLKREARPSDKGTLTARMVDRPIRPGFADGFKREVHVVCTTLVVDSINPPDTICVMGASAALMLGAAPFDGPAACVRIGRDVETGEFIVNPTFEESENSDLELTIAGTADYISMVEAGADEISEEDMLAAMTFGQEAIAAFCEAQQRFLDRANIEPVEWPVHVADPAIAERVAPFMAEMSAALRDADKLSRMGKVEELKARIKEEQFSDEERAAWKGDIAAELKKLEDLGFGGMPVCMAKTQYSFSDDQKKLGAPRGFRITVRNAKVSAGAGFVVALTGDIMTMPGLPKVPAAERIDVDETGRSPACSKLGAPPISVEMRGAPVVYYAYRLCPGCEFRWLHDPLRAAQVNVGARVHARALLSQLLPGSLPENSR